MWALVGWLVPGLNLVRPKQMMDDLWRASAEDVALCSSDWRRGPRSVLSRLWWSTLWIGGLLAAAAGLASVRGHAVTGVRADVAAGLAAAAAIVLAVLGAVPAGARAPDRRPPAPALGRSSPIPRPGSCAGPEPGQDEPIPTRHEALTSVSGSRRTTALRLEPSTRRPVYGKY